MKTRIYHITKFLDSSSYIFFNGCNWDCEFCIMKKYKYDIHSPQSEEINKKIEFLDLEKVMEILLNNNIKEVFLGGGEPTIDNSLPYFLMTLRENNIKINLLTNGELLNENIVNLSDRIAFSIKTLDEDLHMKIVHRSNRKSLENLKKYFNEKFSFETVYLNELGCNNVFQIAKFLEGFKNGLKLRVDPLIPVNDKFLRPDLNAVDDCINFVLNNTSTVVYRIKSTGKNAKVLYP